jgi:ribonuclease-3
MQGTIRGNIVTDIQKLNNDYQRLEFLGDRVLNLIVSHYLFEKFHKNSAGEFTDKLKFTSNDNLEEIIDNLSDEFKKELFKFKSGFKTEAQDLIADDVEAFIGNYYLENGPGKTINYFENLLAKEIDAFDPNTDYISMLQIYTQKEMKDIPDYKPVKEEMAPNNEHLFYFEVSVRKNLVGEGFGNSKSKARKQAALAALKKYGLIS